MITFKLDDRSAEVMVSVLNAVHPDASFVQDITAQYVAATTEEIPEVLIKEIASPAAVAAFMDGVPHEQFDEEAEEE